MTKARFARLMIRAGQILYWAFMAFMLAGIGLCLWLAPLLTIVISIGLFLVIGGSIWAMETLDRWAQSDQDIKS
jgi:hypothetical protein